MSLDNSVAMVLAVNRISALFNISFKVLYATYSLNDCLLQCEVSQQSVRGISRYLGLSTKKGIHIMHALKTGLNADKFASIHGKSRTRSRSRLSI